MADLLANAFPLDNKDYTAADFGAWLSTRTRGVFSSDGHFKVTANGSMTITVSGGLAWMKRDDFWGFCYYETKPVQITIAPPTTMDSAYCAITLQHNKIENETARTYKYGTLPTEEPLPLWGDDFFEELIVALIPIRRGQTSIIQSDIIPTVLDENRCGIMRDGVTGIPTEALYLAAKEKIDLITAFQYEQKTYRDEAEVFADRAREYSSSAHSSATESLKILFDMQALMETITNIREPDTGNYVTIQEYVDNHYNRYHRTGALSAGEYRALGLTAAQYRAYGLTAHDYAMNGKTLLGG